MPDDQIDPACVDLQEKERGFNLPLTTWVEGLDEEGQFFKEQTSITYISHHGASFWLNTPIALDGELKLTIDLPPKLSKDQNLKLFIRGRIIFLERVPDQNPRLRVSLKFESRYIIQNEDVE